MANTITYSGWDQTADFEEGDITDTDSTTPTWDKTADFEEGDTSDFDAESDADGDLNAATDAAREGTYGIEITFDDSNAAYGDLNPSSASTTGVLSFEFNPNSVSMGTNEYIHIARADSGGAAKWRLRLFYDGSDYQLYMVHSLDSGTTTSSKYTITDGWQHVMMLFVRSSGAGANDGWARLYVDGVEVVSLTGMDNDTVSWDGSSFGMIDTDVSSPSGSYYMDEIRIDPVGGPFANRAAAINGTYGMAIPFNNTTGRNVRLSDPSAETSIMVEFEFDPSNLTLPATSEFTTMRLVTDGGTPPVGMRLEWQLTSGEYKWSWVSWDDSNGVETNNTPYNHGASATAHTVKLLWIPSSAPGADDGAMYLYIDNVLEGSATGLDTDTITIGAIDFGAASGIDAGTYGVAFFDDLQWSDGLSATMALDAVPLAVTIPSLSFYSVDHPVEMWLDDQIATDMHIKEQPVNEDE